MSEKSVDPTLSIAREHLWRIAQGVNDPKAAAKAGLAELGVDYDTEQARINAQHAIDESACSTQPTERNELERASGRRNGE